MNNSIRKRIENMKKIFLITGANSQVGMAYIRKLNRLDEDITVYACYRNESEEFERLLQENTDIDIISCKVDLSDEKQVEKMINELTEKGVCPTNILHLSAAKFEYMKVKQWDFDKVREEMEIVLYSFAHICKAFLPVMAKQKSGKVVAMLSSYTLGTPPKFMSDYVACKYALLGFLKSAAAEYAAKGLNINGISPGMMETKFLDNIDDRIIEMNAHNTATGRNTTVEETVGAIEFLMSDASSYMNGVNLNLSGGDYMP